MFLLRIEVKFLFVILIIPMLMSIVLEFFENTPTVRLLKMIVPVIGYALLLSWFASIFRILYQKEIISLKKYIWLIVVLLNILFLMVTVLLHTAGILNFAAEYIVFLAQYGLCFLAYSIIEVSIALRKYELQRSPSFEEWFLEAVCFFFYPIGVWLIQPKLNKMIGAKVNNT